MNASYSTTHPLRLGWQALKALYEDLFVFALLSLLTWVSALSVVLFFPGVAALFEMARRALEGRAVSVGAWWEEVKGGGRRAWGVGLVSVFITLVLISNVVFYARLEASLWRYLAVLWLWLLLIWGMSLPYVWAFNVLLTDPRLGLVLRNAIYLVFLRPFHAVVAVLLLSSLAAISVVFPLFLLILPAYVALYATLLARQLVVDLQRRHRVDD